MTTTAPVDALLIDEATEDPTVTRSRRWQRAVWPAAAFVAIIAIGSAMGHGVPTWIDAHVMPAVDRAYHWTQLNNDKNWFFRNIFSPIGTAINWCCTHMQRLLESMRWPGVMALTGLIGYRTSGIRAAATGVILLAGCGVLGFWDHTVITLSLMLVAVITSLLIGIPLGIWSGLSQRAETVMRSFLDTAQVMPVYVYLLPLVVAFNIGNPAAVIATVIFAVPPAVRITSLGIRSVTVTSTEVGTSFGCTGRQLLLKVRLPLARRAILLGVNQVIMMAFGVVVIASLIGTGGLGQDVLTGLQKVDVGKAFPPGLALVFLAIAIDRVTTGERRRGGKVSRKPAIVGRIEAKPAVTAAVAVGLIVVTAVIAKVAGGDHFPGSWSVDIVKPVNSLTNWVQDHFRKGVPIVGGTQSFSDFFIIHMLDPVRDLLQHAAWYLIVAVVTVIAWFSGGPKLAGVCFGAFFVIGSLRVWNLAMDTLSQVLVAVVLTVVIAIPLGVWAARSRLVERILRPLLDVAQVMPAFVYLVPVLILFRVGRTPGVIASVIYAIPPAIRLTTLGLREVPYAPREAALSFGATPRQELIKVQLPLAIRAIMLAINQAIIMVLSMVVIAALIGAGGLGLEAVFGLTKKQVGRGAAGGLAIVCLAIVLDRVTQAWGNRARLRSAQSH